MMGLECMVCPKDDVFLWFLKMPDRLVNLISDCNVPKGLPETPP